MNPKHSDIVSRRLVEQLRRAKSPGEVKRLFVSISRVHVGSPKTQRALDDFDRRVSNHSSVENIEAARKAYLDAVIRDLGFISPYLKMANLPDGFAELRKDGLELAAACSVKPQLENEVSALREELSNFVVSYPVLLEACEALNTAATKPGIKKSLREGVSFYLEQVRDRRA